MLEFPVELIVQCDQPDNLTHRAIVHLDERDSGCSAVVHAGLSNANCLSLRQKEHFDATKNNPVIIIDCDFDHLHDNKTVLSAAQQIMYAYNSCKAAKKSCLLYACGVTAKTAGGLAKMNSSSWCAWLTSKRLEDLVQCNKRAADEKPVVSDDPLVRRMPLHFTYLSPDAVDTISIGAEFAADSQNAYIIGGLIDRNRFKHYCQRKAEMLSIPTARLPLDTAMVTCKTITTNHAAAIVQHRVDGLSWTEAFERVLPSRKISEHESKKKRRKRTQAAPSTAP